MSADNEGLMMLAEFDAASRSAAGAELAIAVARGAIFDIHDLRAVLCAPCRAVRGVTTVRARLG